MADDRKIERDFRRFFSVAIPFIGAIILANIIDVLFRINLGFKPRDLIIGVGILIFSFILRFVGLKIIRAFST